jgi:hypothetical protein
MTSQSIRNPTIFPTEKELPKRIKTIATCYEYGLVRFRDRKEAYSAERQMVEFSVAETGGLGAQVWVHMFLRGTSLMSGKRETIDADFYLSISEFRNVRRLLEGLRFKKDHSGVTRPIKRRAKRRKR